MGDQVDDHYDQIVFQIIVIGYLPTMKSLFIGIIIFTITSTVLPLSPNCRASDFYKILPLTPQEAYMVDLGKLFGGYNLDFNLTATEDIEKYLHIGRKVKLNDEQGPDDPMIGLKSYHLTKKGNAWGQQFITLTQRGDRTQVHSGFLNANSTAPVINYYINVENMTNTTCFDAVQVASSNLIIVDCVQKKAAKDSRGRIYQNLMYYFRINDGSKVKELRTEMYVPFQNIKRRRLLLYNDLQSAHTFLLRAYTTQGMGDATKDNTYLQVLMLEDALNPWIVGLIDRTFFGVPKLRISDVKVYLNQIYILDQAKGVHRVYISGAEDLHYRGCYQARNFKRLAVYSSNLDNRIQIAMANTHVVHEIDWTDVAQPRLVNKYSLLPDSKVSQVFLNDRFIFVRSSATDSDGTYNYTWTFTRGDRTFSRAFSVMKHELDSTLIDFNQQMSYLMVITQSNIQNYAYDDPSFRLQINDDPQLMNKISAFTLIATSWDPSMQGANVTCNITVNFTLLEPNNRTMWVVGNGPPPKFTANYPGKVRLQLQQYVLGPNVTYRIRQTKKGQLPKAKVYQQQQLSVSWSTQPPPFQNTTFLQSETFTRPISDILMIYTQDELNMTYISRCSPHHQLLNVSCQLVQQRQFQGKISNWGTAMVQETVSQDQHHVLGYTTEKEYNVIYLYDLTAAKIIEQMTVGVGFPSNISSLTLSHKYMFAVLRHIKRVNIYQLQDCLDDNCNEHCSLNHLNMYKEGLKYFAPRQVQTSNHHPDLLFVKTDDSILVVDLSKQCVPKILSIVRPVDNVNTHFKFNVNSDYLVVTIAPDTVQQYDLSRVYLKQIRKAKTYPLYGHTLAPNYAFDISDYGNCIYLSTLNSGGDYNVFVYRSGIPAVGSLYNQIDLYAFQHVLVDASGFRVDYVSVISGKQFRIFRQYERPQGMVPNPSQDYNFYLQYFNTIDSAQLQLVQVQIINLPTYILVNPMLKDIMNTKDLFYSGQNRLNEVNDTNWYQGNVLYIRASCSDCPQKVRVNNHIQEEEKKIIIPKMTAFAYNQAGGELLAQGVILRMLNNGSLGMATVLHNNNKRKCIQIATSNRFVITGCIQTDAIYLQTITQIANKPFTFQALQTNAVQLTRLQAVNQIVMLVDTDPNTYVKGRKGGVFLYQVSSDFQDLDALVQMEFVDGDDFGMRQLGDIYINNGELAHYPEEGVYRLYLSQMNRGILVMQFTHLSSLADIVVKRTQFIPLRTMLQGLGETLPYDATFQAITLMSTYRNNAARTTTDRLLITTGRYHTIQIAVTYDSKSSIVLQVIERLYLRYSFYEVGNQIRHINGLFLVKHTLPPQQIIQDDIQRTQQLYTVYSTSKDFTGIVQKRGLMGALPLQQNSTHRFDFNRTTKPDDKHYQPRVGVVVVQENGNITLASLHRNLSLFTTELLDTQIIYLDLINDFNLERIRILLNGRAPFPEWKLIMIILFSIIGGIILIVVGVFGARMIKQKIDERPEERDTLITQPNDL